MFQQHKFTHPMVIKQGDKQADKLSAARLRVYRARQILNREQHMLTTILGKHQLKCAMLMSSSDSDSSDL